MVLFPIALLWLVGVIVWVVRNEGSPGLDVREWRRWLPRRPRSPLAGPDRGAHVAGGIRARRAASGRRAVGAARKP